MSEIERLIPDELGEGITGRDTLALHLQRYEFAAQHARGPRFLDIACGVGYGAHLIAGQRGDLHGVAVDIAADAIAYARDRYAHDRLRFEVADAMRFTDSEGFDTIVSFETIEHLEDPQAFVARMTALLRPGGIFIASVPVTFSTDVNPHHRHDFSARSFRRLFEELRLQEVAALTQVQKYRLAPILLRSEPRMAGLRENLLAYYATHPLDAARRLMTTITSGLSNRYLTLALVRANGQ